MFAHKGGEDSKIRVLGLLELNKQSQRLQHASHISEVRYHLHQLLRVVRVEGRLIWTTLGRRIVGRKEGLTS